MRIYLCICATSVVSERVFGSAGYIGSNLRSYLNHENMDILTFLKSNWAGYILFYFKLVLILGFFFFFFWLYISVVLYSFVTCCLYQFVLNTVWFCNICLMLILLKCLFAAISTAYIKGCLQVEIKYSYFACICISPYPKCISLHPGHLYVLWLHHCSLISRDQSSLKYHDD